VKKTVTSDGTWKASRSLPLKKVGSGKQLHAISWRQEKPAPCGFYSLVISGIVWLIGVNSGDRCPLLKTYRYLSRVTKSLRTGQTGRDGRPTLWRPRCLGAFEICTARSNTRQGVATGRTLLFQTVCLDFIGPFRAAMLWAGPSLCSAHCVSFASRL